MSWTYDQIKSWVFRISIVDDMCTNFEMDPSYMREVTEQTQFYPEMDR